MTTRSREQNREYMRDYMRERRRAGKDKRKRNRDADRARKRAEYKSEAPDVWSKADFVRPDRALYDPRRDGPLHRANLTAELMKDPPIGWRAIVERHQQSCATRPISLAGAQP